MGNIILDLEYLGNASRKMARSLVAESLNNMRKWGEISYQYPVVQ